MNRDLKPRTSEAHGRLWGVRARDWADFQEGTVPRPPGSAAYWHGDELVNDATQKI
jgi:hypothetical protein